MEGAEVEIGWGWWTIFEQLFWPHLGRCASRPVWGKPLKRRLFLDAAHPSSRNGFVSKNARVDDRFGFVSKSQGQ